MPAFRFVMAIYHHAADNDWGSLCIRRSEKESNPSGIFLQDNINSLEDFIWCYSAFETAAGLVPRVAIKDLPLNEWKEVGVWLNEEIVNQVLKIKPYSFKIAPIAWHGLKVKISPPAGGRYVSTYSLEGRWE